MGLFNRKHSKQKANLIDIRNGALIDGNNRYDFSNCLIAGIKSQGRDALIRSLIIDSINENKAVIVIQNGNALPNNTLRDEFATNSGCRNFFSLDFSKQYFTDSINVFKETSINFVKELLMLLMASYKDMTPDNKNFAERYLNEVFDLLQYRLPPVKKFTLSDMADFDKDWIETEANRLHSANKIDTKKRDKTLNYVNDLSLFKKELYEYENFCNEIQKQNFADLLSGNLLYSELNSPRYITFLIMDFITSAKQSKAMLKLLIHRAIHEMRTARVDTTFVFEDMDISIIMEFYELLRACNSKAGDNVYFTVDKISNFNNANFDPRTYCNSYFVFKQTIASEAEEWAKTSGTYKKDKATETTAPYNQVYGRQNEGLSGAVTNILNRKKQVVTGTSHEIVDEYNILPSDFMDLDAYTSQVIISDNSGRKYMKQIKWA